MTTADIDVGMDYGAMGKLASQVETAQTDFTEMCKNFDSLVSSLDGQWQGKAQKEFSSAYEKLRPKLKTISTTLESYAKSIRDTAANEAALESESAKNYEKNAFPVVGNPTLK